MVITRRPGGSENKKITILALALALVLASVGQAAPLRSSRIFSWWDFVLGFFGLKGEPTVPIRFDNKGRPPTAQAYGQRHAQR